jgi:hypothetical protein
MSLEKPVSHLKIHGFGAFQQCAEFFLYDCRSLLTKNQLPLQEDEWEFLEGLTNTLPPSNLEFSPSHC